MWCCLGKPWAENRSVGPGREPWADCLSACGCRNPCIDNLYGREEDNRHLSMCQLRGVSFFKSEWVSRVALCRPFTAVTPFTGEHTPGQCSAAVRSTPSVVWVQ
eukprot:EG_transcript_38854